MQISITDLIKHKNPPTCKAEGFAFCINPNVLRIVELYGLS
jgi:hypothetical protein